MCTLTRAAGALIALAASALAQITFAPDQGISGFVPATLDDVAVADMDSDGDLDLVTEGNDVVVWYENLGGGFGPVALIDALTSITDLAVGDVDGDGDADVVTAQFQTGIFQIGRIVWNRNLGPPNFSGAIQIDDFPRPLSVRLADFDADGDLDLAAVAGLQSMPRSLLLYENLGGGNFAGEVIISSSLVNPAPLRVADADGDGDDDLFVPQRNQGSIAYFRNDAGQFVSAGTIPTMSTELRDSTFADLDGDGDLDLAVVAAPSAGVEVFENVGNAAFTSLGIVFAAPAFSITASDLDGDGDPDLLVNRFSPDEVQVLRNDGGFAFVPVVTLASASSGADSVNAADLDDDGDQDVILGLDNSSALVWSENITAYTPPLPGSNDALILETGVNDLATQRPALKAASSGDLLSIGLRGRGGAFADAVPVLFAQVYAAGATLVNPGGFPEAWINPAFAGTAPVFTLWDGNAAGLGVGVLGTSGVSVAVVIPPLGLGLDVVLQGFVLAPSAVSGNSLFTATDAHRIEVTP